MIIRVSKTYPRVAALGCALAAASPTVAMAAPPNVPSCQNGVQYYGGSVIAHPKVNLIYWGDWSNLNPQYTYNSFWQRMANYPGFYTRLNEYGVQAGSFGTAFPQYTAGAIGFISDSTVQQGVLAVLGCNPQGQNCTYQATDSDVFVVFFPSNTGDSADFDSTFTSRTAGGHHWSFTANGVNYRTAVIEFDPNPYPDGTNSAAHELLESFTNPDPSYGHTAWAAPHPQGEIVDLCAPDPVGYGFIGGLETANFWSQKMCRCVTKRNLNEVDALADGIPDPTIFRPSQVAWYAAYFPSVWAWGQSSDIPFAADFDGDGRTEFALFRGGTSNMFGLNIVNGPPSAYTWTIGTSGDFPVTGDYDGDGISDPAVWQPAYGWRVKASSASCAPPCASASDWHPPTWGPLTVGAGSGSNGNPVMWGIAGDVPAQADYDGDGMTDFAVFRTSPQNQAGWYIVNSSQPGTSEFASWTIIATNDIPVPGDYNGDGCADFAFWRPSDGSWHVSYNLPPSGSPCAKAWSNRKNSITPAAWTLNWGVYGDIPVPADYDGDWATDLGIWRPSEGNWYFWLSSIWGHGNTPLQWGQLHDFPLQEPASVLLNPH